MSDFPFKAFGPLIDIETGNEVYFRLEEDFIACRDDPKEFADLCTSMNEATAFLREEEQSNAVPPSKTAGEA